MKSFRVLLDNFFYCLFGPACTKAGGTLWQGDRGEFDSRLVHIFNALMAKLVTAPDLGSGSERIEGSTPSRGTKLNIHMKRIGSTPWCNGSTLHESCKDV